MEINDIISEVVGDIKKPFEETQNGINIKSSVTFADCFNMLKGNQVIAETDDGQLFTGILRECSDELDIKLSFAQKIPIPENSEFILCRENAEELLELKKVTRLTGDYSITEQIRNDCKGFLIDREIGTELNDEANGKEKEFEPWHCEGEDFEFEELPSIDDKTAKRQNKKGSKCEGRGGWNVNEMFEMNKDKVVGESTFDDSLSQYSNVEVNKSSDEQIKRADEIAKSIENNQESKHNALLENDDDERDLHAETEPKGDECPEQSQAPFYQHPQPRPLQQRPMRENIGQRKAVGGNNVMSSGNRRWERNSGQMLNSAERSVGDHVVTAGRQAGSWSNDWRNPQQRSYYNNKSGSGNFHSQPRPFQPHHQHQSYGKGRYTNRASSYDTTTNSQISGIVEHPKTDAINELRMATEINKSDKPSSTSAQHSHPQSEDQGCLQIPPDPEITANEPKNGKQGEECGERQCSTEAAASESAIPNDTEIERELAEQTRKFEFNPDAEPFIPKPKDKDLNNSSPASITFPTAPLMSSQVSTLVPLQVQMPSAVTAQGITPQNLLYGIYQPQQPPTVVQPQVHPNAFYAIQTGNPAQPIIYLPAANQAVILQQGVAHPQQHFVPVTATAITPQNIHQLHYRTGTPNGVPNHPLQHQSHVADSAAGNPIIAQPTTAIFPQSLPPTSQSNVANGAPLVHATGIHGAAVPLFPNFQHMPPAMHFHRTGTPNSGGLTSHAPPPQSQQQLAEPTTVANTIVAQQQHQHVHQLSTTQSTPGTVHPGGGVPNATPLLSNISQLPPNMLHYRTGTPNGGQGQTQQPPHTQIDSTGNNSLMSQQHAYPPPHPVAQGMLIQNANVQPLLNLMPPNVVPAPPQYHGR